jgi:gluconolactonase
MQLEIELKVVADGLGFPEGPVALHDGSILFVDIAEKKLMRLEAGGKPELVVDLPGGPNGLAIGPDGCAYVCNNGGVFDFTTIPLVKEQRSRNDYLLVPNGECPGNNYGKYALPGKHVPKPSQAAAVGDQDPDKVAAGAIWRVDLKTKEVVEIYGPSKGSNLIAPDDIVFDTHGPVGSFWFTDCGYQNSRIVRKGGVYSGTVTGGPLTKIPEIPSANGIGFSKAGDILYVADTLFGRLWALRMDPNVDPQEPTRKVLPPKFPGAPPGDVVLNLPGLQWVDSLKIEDSDRVCVATLRSGGITIFNPHDNTTDFLPVGTPLPGMSKGDPFTSNLCFGGANMCDVWITASASGKIYHGTWPRPGLKPAFDT